MSMDALRRFFQRHDCSHHYHLVVEDDGKQKLPCGVISMLNVSICCKCGHRGESFTHFVYPNRRSG